MKKYLIATLLVFSVAAHAGTAFRCFSKYYTSNASTIVMSGYATYDNEVTKFSLNDKADGLNASISVLRADPSYKPRKYKGYNLYFVANNHGSRWSTKSVAILLPNNITHLTGRFSGYVSDCNEDGSGSEGYFQVLCSVQ